MISAHPVDLGDAKLERAVVAVSEAGSEGVFLPESKVQMVFAEVGKEIPAPDPSQSAIRPEIIQVEEDFLNKANEDWSRLHPEDRPFLQGTSAPGLRAGPNRFGQESNPLSVATNAVLATTGAPSAPLRWWLPVAVLSGLGVIAVLLLRARRRSRSP